MVYAATPSGARTSLFVAIACAACLCGDSDYRTEIATWRSDREAKLKADDGWLTLVGLSWLRPGATTVGADPACDVVLPAGAPENLGVLTLADGKAQFSAAPGVELTVAGKPFRSGEIRSDASGDPDVIAAGTIRITLIQRGARLALRIKDNASPDRKAFSGLSWFDVDESWRIEAQFTPYAVAKTVAYETIVGEAQSLKCPGKAVFERAGATYSLEPVQEGDRLWFVFRDLTSGKTTHPGARQLYADAPDASGKVVLDFNKAMNLPCAFTRYATCPLPPPSNRLRLAVTAGEKKYTQGAAQPH